MSDIQIKVWTEEYENEGFTLHVDVSGYDVPNYLKEDLGLTATSDEDWSYLQFFKHCRSVDTLVLHLEELSQGIQQTHWSLESELERVLRSINSLWF